MKQEKEKHEHDFHIQIKIPLKASSVYLEKKKNPQDPKWNSKNK